MSFDDVCSQTVPFRDHSVAEEILPNIVQMKKTVAIDILPSCYQLVRLDQISSQSAFFQSSLIKRNLSRRSSYDKLLNPFTNLVAFRCTRSRQSIFFRR